MKTVIFGFMFVTTLYVFQISDALAGGKLKKCLDCLNPSQGQVLAEGDYATLSDDDSSPQKSETYALGVGQKASDRLNVMDSLIQQDSHEHLLRAGLKAGMRVVEVGCGSGAMTEWISRQVGNDGEVIALDISEKQLQIASQRIKSLGLENVNFIHGDVLKTDQVPQGQADIVYIRLVLMHVADPVAVLQRALTFLKPGGKVVSQEPISSTAESNKSNELFQRMNQVIVGMGAYFKGDYDIGLRLADLVEQAGCENVQRVESQRSADVTQMQGLLLKGIPECKPAAIKAGVSTEQELDGWYETLSAWPKTDHEFYYRLPKQIHVIGTKHLD